MIGKSDVNTPISTGMAWIVVLFYLIYQGYNYWDLECELFQIRRVRRYRRGNQNPYTLDPEKYPLKPERECQMTCKGNRRQKCGGTWRNLIYHGML